MILLRCILLSLLLLRALSLSAEARSFPSTPDATEAAQHRWGTTSGGYIAEGCWFGASASAAVQVQPCRAFVLEPGAVPALKGFREDTARTLTFSGGDGIYWVAGRTSPGVAAPGWTCLEGLHYCWTKRDTPPEVPAGLGLLAQSTVSAGAARASVLLAPLRRTVPYVVPAGVTLTLGVCPEAPRRQLWVADGTTTGLVRFGPGACGWIYPEWWGADPSGIRDSGEAWQLTLDAAMTSVSGEGNAAVACEGTYKISRTLTITPRLTIQGPYSTSTVSSIKHVPCQIEYYGTATLFDAPDRGSTYNDLAFQRLRLVDMQATGQHAFRMVSPVGMHMHDIAIQGFAQPLYLVGYLYYSWIDGVNIRHWRERCAEISGPANYAAVDITCGASLPGSTVQHGIRVGGEPGWFGTSYGPRLQLSVEGAGGTPIILGRLQGARVSVYIETPGVCTDYSSNGVLQLSRLEGGSVHAMIQGNCTGGAGIARGIYVVSSSTEGNTRNLVLTGRVFGSFFDRVHIGPDENSWGLEITGLDTGTTQNPLGNYTTGLKLGNNYWTHGSAPLVDQGRGSTADGTIWQTGDLIWQGVPADASIGNTLRQVTVGGNPPTTALLIWPTATALTLANGDATPSVKVGNTYFTRATAVASATNITALDDGQEGQCVDIRATGGRTFEHSATLQLSGAVNFAMVAESLLRLCLDGGVWREWYRRP